MPRGSRVDMASQAKRRRKRTLIHRHGARCVKCGREFPVAELTLDHVVPRSHGGTNALTNLQLMCEPCNQEKADTVPARLEIHPWRPERINGGHRKVAA